MNIFQHNSKGVLELERAPELRRRRSLFFSSENRALSIRSNKGSSSATSPVSRKGFSFSSLRGSIQPELSKRLYRLIKSTNTLISAHESAGKERVVIATQLSEWGEQTGDEAVSDISDKVGVVLSEIGELEDSYAHALDDARARLKVIRNTERSVQPSRGHKDKIADEIQRLKLREPQSARIVTLEHELVRAEAENLVAEAQLSNITRKNLKEAYDAELAAIIERAEKQILLAKHGRRLLALLDEEPVTPGDRRRPYTHGAQARQILNDAEEDLKNWALQLDEAAVPGERANEDTIPSEGESAVTAPSTMASEAAGSSPRASGDRDSRSLETARQQAYPSTESTGKGHVGNGGTFLSYGSAIGGETSRGHNKIHAASSLSVMEHHTIIVSCRSPEQQGDMDALIWTSRLSQRSALTLCRSCNRRLRPQLARSYASATAQPDIYDVVCVGGGPAGLSLLTALRANPVTAGLRVALVEAQDLQNLRSWKLPPDRYSNRCSSLTPASANFLNRIGAWEHVNCERVQPYHEMQVWDGVSDARIEFDWAPGSAGGKTIAYMIENLNLTSGLIKRLDELGNTAIFDSARVENIALGEETEEMDLREWPIVHLAGGKQLAARLLVGADGANSPVRTFAQIPSRGWDYERHGVVATLELEGEGWGGDDMKVAYQRFLPTGPVAMLSLPGNLSTLVWSTTPSNAALLKSLSAKDFIALVNAAFRLSPVDLEFMHTAQSGQQDELTWRLQHTPVDSHAVPQTVVGVQEGTVASFPLKLRHADTYIGERVALVGDAAHTIHPLAGQGLNQGQGDVEGLARTIEYAASHGQDVGTRMSLEPYNSERYAANHVLLGVCDKLHRLYSVGGGPLVPLRSLGLNAVNAMRPVKQFFMNQAAGNGIKLF
ncbi:hypothetical protein DL763_002124 [Monosporascus cannonballus]|nr:hypothetical protein DL763_002124 [Monosporascus cannonballus]